MKKLALALLAIMTLASCPLHAQEVISPFKVVWRKPDCAPLRVEYDNVWDGVGWRMPKAAWWIQYATLSQGIAYGLHKAGLSKKQAAWAAAVGVGLVPHIRGQAALRYNINIMDWAFDFHTRSAPVYLLDNPSKKKALIYAAGVVGLSCWADP